MRQKKKGEGSKAPWLKTSDDPEELTMRANPLTSMDGRPDLARPNHRLAPMSSLPISDGDDVQPYSSSNDVAVEMMSLPTARGIGHGVTTRAWDLLFRSLVPPRLRWDRRAKPSL